MNLIQADQLSIGYHSPLQKNIDLSLELGDLLVIKGRNGVGKSTLIKTILGILKPLDGKIIISASEVSFLPQAINYDLGLSLTLEELLESFEVDKELQGFLERDLFKSKWDEISGGEKQKALILSRMKDNCDLLILDEPFNHLDKVNTKSLQHFLRKLLEEKKIKGILMVSHIEPQTEIWGKIKYIELT